MKVLFLTPSLGAGGAERQCSILLPGLRSRGMDARIVALDAGGPFVQSMREAGVPVEVLRMRHQADVVRLARSKLVRSFVPDALVSRGLSGLYVGHAIARWRGASHVFADHYGAGIRFSPRREAMARLILRGVGAVITVSPDQAGAWRERGYPADRVVVVPNGVREPQVEESKSEIRRELGIPDAAIVALLVAALRPEKRVPDFVRAVLGARETAPELIGVIAGDGTERAVIQAAAGGTAGIRLLGYRDDVPRLLHAADVLVLASEYEAVPMSILEGMAAGLPVLATRVGGIPDVVAHGESGVLVAPGDTDAMSAALTRLAGAPELRLAMGAAGRERHRERWDAETMIDGYVRVLEQVVAGTG
jgi:glycosyltransferase involved in cell wall biosynthesis